MVSLPPSCPVRERGLTQAPRLAFSETWAVVAEGGGEVPWSPASQAPSLCPTTPRQRRSWRPFHMCCWRHVPGPCVSLLSVIAAGRGNVGANDLWALTQLETDGASSVGDPCTLTQFRSHCYLPAALRGHGNHKKTEEDTSFAGNNTTLAWQRTQTKHISSTSDPPWSSL